nr:MAG TPA: protein of unknown function (DUF2115) [Caudoviricetes sp.]
MVALKGGLFYCPKQKDLESAISITISKYFLVLQIVQ